MSLQPFEFDPNEKNRHKFMVQSMFAPEGDINQDTLVSDTELQQYIFFPENFLYDLLSGFILTKLLLFLAPRPSPHFHKICLPDVRRGNRSSNVANVGYSVLQRYRNIRCTIIARALSLSLLPVEGHRPRSVDGLEAEVHVRDARGERDEQRVVRGGPQQHRQRPPHQVRFGTPQAGRAALVAQGERGMALRAMESSIFLKPEMNMPFSKGAESEIKLIPQIPLGYLIQFC